jgi:hypothetical protein
MTITIHLPNKQYTRNRTYKKGYQVHNQQNAEEIEAGNDLRAFKVEGWTSSGPHLLRQVKHMQPIKQSELAWSFTEYAEEDVKDINLLDEDEAVALWKRPFDATANG